MDERKIIEEIEKITQKTVDGRMQWKQMEPGFLRWTHIESSRSFFTTLQKLNLSSALPSDYYFTLQATDPAEVLLQINSRNKPGVREALKKMYDIATKAINDRTVNTIDSLLNRI